MRALYAGGAATLTLCAFAGVASARCQLQDLGALSVTLRDLSPVVMTQINGVNAPFVLDTANFYSTISPDAAARYHLTIRALPTDQFLIGAVGTGRTQLATVKTFSFLGVPLHHVKFQVIRSDVQGRSIGVLGENLLHFSDVEYDLANRVVRFIRPVGCGDRPLAYWAVHQPYSTVRLVHIGRVHTRLIAHAQVNGQRLTVLFDTGAPRSVLSLQAARRAGITRHSPGVKPLGMLRGVGPTPIPAWSAPINTFRIGNENVERTRLIIANINPDRPALNSDRGRRRPDMIVGDDFFLSQRIFVAYGQHKLYFTYNGGPLFILKAPHSTRTGDAAANEDAKAADRRATLIVHQRITANGNPNQALAERVTRRVPDRRSSHQNAS